MTPTPPLPKLLADFNRYFTSANGVDVPERVSVSRDEWRVLFEALSQRGEAVGSIEETEALAQPAPPEQPATASAHAANIERKVYKNSPEHSEYLRARFGQKHRAGISFEWDGHRWSYRHTSFDDAGEYDMLWRPVPPASQEQAGAVVNAAVNLPEQPTLPNHFNPLAHEQTK